MLRAALIASSFLIAAPALAQAEPGDSPAEQAALDRAARDPQAQTGQPPQRIRSVALTGNQKCPPSTATEVVVCSRIDPNEQFRVPKQLRAPLEVPAQNQSWVNRTATLDQVSRAAGGVPGSCSAVGTAGQTGCPQAAVRDWYANRRQQAREAQAPVPASDE